MAPLPGRMRAFSRLGRLFSFSDRIRRLLPAPPSPDPSPRRLRRRLASSLLKPARAAFGPDSIGAYPPTARLPSPGADGNSGDNDDDGDDATDEGADRDSEGADRDWLSLPPVASRPTVLAPAAGPSVSFRHFLCRGADTWNIVAACPPAGHLHLPPAPVSLVKPAHG